MAAAAGAAVPAPRRPRATEAEMRISSSSSPWIVPLAALVGVLLLAACADAPTAPANPPPPRLQAAAAPTDGSALVPNSVKYRDAGGRPATGRGGSATLAARALLGADGWTEVEAATGGLDAPGAGTGTLARVQVKAWEGDRLRLAANEPGEGTDFRAPYPGLLRRSRVQVQALVRGADRARTDVVTVGTEVLLRPDLAVALVAPPSVEAGTHAPILATISERNGDVGARADCVLYVDGAPADRADGIWVDAGDAVACRFSPRLDTPGTRRLVVRLENVAPADFDPADDTAGASVDVLRSERIFYSASAEDRTFTSHLTWRRTYRETTPDTYDLFRTDDQTGRVQASVLYGSFPAGLAAPFTADVAQETGGTVLHAASYASTTAGCLVRNDTDAGVSFSLCTSSVSGGSTTLDYERHTGAVTYESAETLYLRLPAGMQWRLIYSWTRNRVEATGATPDFGADFTFRVTVRDPTGVWRAAPTFPLTQFAGTGGHPYTCSMYENPWHQWETYCEDLSTSASGVRGAASLQP
jgi:hypothetical protein